MLVAQLCPTLCNPMDYSPPDSCPWDSPGKNTGVGSYFFLQGIFPTQGSNPGLLHCRQIPYHLNRQGSPSFNKYEHKRLHEVEGPSFGSRRNQWFRQSESDFSEGVSSPSEPPRNVPKHLVRSSRLSLEETRRSSHKVTFCPRPGLGASSFSTVYVRFLYLF